MKLLCLLSFTLVQWDARVKRAAMLGYIASCWEPDSPQQCRAYNAAYALMEGHPNPDAAFRLYAETMSDLDIAHGSGWVYGWAERKLSLLIYEGGKEMQDRWVFGEFKLEPDAPPPASLVRSLGHAYAIAGANINEKHGKASSRYTQLWSSDDLVEHTPESIIALLKWRNKLKDI